MPRPAPADHQGHPGVQADAHRRRLLAGEREEPAAAADLRHRLGVPGLPGQLRQDARGGREARPPQARRRARPVLVPDRDRQRPAGLPSQGRHHPPGDGGLLAPPSRGGRVRLRQHPAPDQGRPVHHLRAPGVVQGRHVPAHGTGRGHLLPEADELPDAHPDLRIARAVLPGAAPAAVRVRDGVPVREVRSGARPDPGPRLHPGRLAHLLRPRAAAGRARVAAEVRGRAAARLRADRVRGGAVHPAGQVRRRARGVGGRRGRAQARARRPPACST